MMMMMMMMMKQRMNEDGGDCGTKLGGNNAPARLGRFHARGSDITISKDASWFSWMACEECVWRFLS